MLIYQPLSFATKVDFISIPNHHLRFIYNAMAVSSNLDLYLHRAKINSKGSSKIRIDTSNHRIYRTRRESILKLTMKNEISRPTRNILLYIFHRIGVEVQSELDNDLRIEFPLNDLKRIGMFEDYREKSLSTPRRYFRKAIEELLNIRLYALTTVRNGKELVEVTNIEDSKETNVNLFIDGGVENSICYIVLNHRVNWNLCFLQSFVLMPTTYWRMNNNNAKDLFYNIFSRARQHTKAISAQKKEVSFTINLKEIQAFLNLPSEKLLDFEIGGIIDNLKNSKEKTKTSLLLESLLRKYSIDDIKALLKGSGKDVQPLLQELKKGKSHTRRDIIEPIITAIEDCQREDVTRTDFILNSNVLIYQETTSGPCFVTNCSCDEFLSGYLEVKLRGKYAEKIIEISQKKRKLIEKKSKKNAKKPLKIAI